MFSLKRDLNLLFLQKKWLIINGTNKFQNYKPNLRTEDKPRITAIEFERQNC